MRKLMVVITTLALTGCGGIRITFFGLTAFVPEGGNAFRVILPDVRAGRTFDPCTAPASCQITIPPHAARILFPGHSWTLEDHDLEIEAINPSRTSISSRWREFLGNMTAIQAAVGGIHSTILTGPDPGNAVVARLKLSRGKLEVPDPVTAIGPAQFRAIDGSATSPASGQARVAMAVQYVIDADSVVFRRKSFGTTAWETVTVTGDTNVYVLNIPEGGSTHAVAGSDADTHFYLYYDLAQHDVAPTQRYIPMFAGSTSSSASVTISNEIKKDVVGSPRCMMAFYDSQAPAVPSGDAVRER